MSEVKVEASTKYSVIIKNGLLNATGAHISALFRPSKILIVTDSNVDKLYCDTIVDSLKSCKFDVYKFVFKAGEKSKNFKTYLQIISALCENNFSKSDIVVGFGGGVACDIAGFAAATYLRGLRLVMVPTSLLCDVDASVGGKNAVDYEGIKNQVGTIYQPSGILIDPLLLKTLDKKVFNEGIAEIIKYALIDNKPIGSSSLFEVLESGDIDKNIEEIIASSVEIKSQIVQSDEFDTGRRHILNLGHTFAHALEHASSNKISHGVGVANGIRMACRIAVKKGYMDKNIYLRICKVSDRFSLLKDFKYTSDELYSAIIHDKKIRSDSINLIIPYSIGDTRIVKTGLSELKSLLNIALEEI